MVSQPQRPVPRRGQLLNPHHIQAPLDCFLVAPWIAAHSTDCPAPPHPLPLPHLHRRGESGSNALDYGGIAIAIIGVIIAGLGIFWNCWRDRRSRMKRVRILRSHFLWWWLCADDGHKIPMHSQSPPGISSPTENLLVVPRPLGQTGGDSLVVTIELLVQPSQSSLPRLQLPPPVRSRSPLQLSPPPPTRSWTLPT